VKALLHAAGVVRGAAEARRMGISFGAPQVDLQALMSWKGRVVDRLVRGVEYLLRTNGVELVKGTGRFIDRQTVAVAGPAGAEQAMTADAFVIATGSTPAVLPGLEPDGRGVVDSNGMFRITSAPARLVIVGAGVIGLEFATMLSRLGSKVTVLELTAQVLPGVDSEVAAVVEKSLRAEGVEIVTGANVRGVERTAGAVVSYAGPGGEAGVEADLVLVATGRKPLTDGLELASAGVKTMPGGEVEVDERYRTNVRHIHAIGDVKSGPQLAHRAMAEGIALAELLCGGRQWRFTAVPACVYTDPEVALVGLGEAEARAGNRDVLVSRVPVSAVGRSLTLGRGEGLCKLVVDAESDRVLGAAIVAPEADVLIAEATMAVELGLTARQLGRVVHAHPTMSELLFEAAEATHGRAIHIVNR
jgi:dihydrolipoamide dehydrogenase